MLHYDNRIVVTFTYAQLYLTLFLCDLI